MLNKTKNFLTKISDSKIKKSEPHFELALTKTKDIAAYLGEIKSIKQFLVGFALETNDELNNATGIG